MTFIQNLDSSLNLNADFEELVSFIGEELAYDMHSATASRALMSVAIDPGCADWLGM